MILSIAFGILIVGASLLVQTVVLPALGVSALAPHLVLAAIMAVGLTTGKLPGLAAGALTGLTMDLLFTPGLGFYALPLSVLGYWAGALDNWAPEAWGIPPLIIGIGYVGFKAYEAVVQVVAGRITGFTWAMAGRAGINLVMTMAVAFFLYIVCHLFYEHRRRIAQASSNW